MYRRTLPVLLVLVLSPAWLVADTKVTVTLSSDPPGAGVYQGAQLLGYAPLPLQYKAPGRFKACLTLQPLIVRWISGAEADVTGLQACPANSRKQHFSVFRPTGVPGIEVDAQFAIALMQQRNAAQLASQAEWAASLAAMQQQLARPKNCTSTVIGNQVFTNCY